MITPTEQRKLYDIHDVAVSVAANSANGDSTLCPDRGVDVIPSSSITVNAQGFG